MDREEAARQVTQAVTELFFSAENQAKFHGAAEGLGLQPPALKALLELEPDEGAPMRHLAETLACDASFVTVLSDSLEAAGYAVRRVAPHDRRIKTIELTEAGVRAREWALGMVYGPRAGFDALTAHEQITAAELLRKMAAAQARYDETLLAQPEVRSTARRVAAQRTRDYRGRGHRAEGAGGWKEHFDAHRQEILNLKEELARMRDEIKAQARRPIDEAKAAKAEVKAQVKSEAKGVRDEIVGKLKGGRARR